jgi:hypothetical protein
MVVSRPSVYLCFVPTPKWSDPFLCYLLTRFYFAFEMNHTWGKNDEAKHRQKLYLPVVICTLSPRPSERRTPYGPVHVCLSRFSYWSRQPAWPWVIVAQKRDRMSHCWNTLLPQIGVYFIFWNTLVWNNDLGSH